MNSDQEEGDEGYGYTDHVPFQVDRLHPVFPLRLSSQVHVLQLCASIGMCLQEKYAIVQYYQSAVKKYTAYIDFYMHIYQTATPEGYPRIINPHKINVHICVRCSQVGG